MFISLLFTLDKIQNKPTRPQQMKEENVLWTRSGVPFLLKKERNVAFPIECMNLQDTQQSEINQA